MSTEMIPGIEMPGCSVACLDPLVRAWKLVAAKRESSDESARLHAAYASSLLDRWTQSPGLHGPIGDVAVLAEHAALLDEMMSLIFPPALRATQLAGALAPFRHEALYVTERLQRLHATLTLTGRGEVSEEQRSFRNLMPYLLVMERIYGIHPGETRVDTFSYRRRESSGIDTWFSVHVDFNFVDVIAEDAISPLRASLEAALRENLLDLERLRIAVPPGSFRFEGFVVADMRDVTTEEVLNLLRQELLHPESTVQPARVRSIQQNLRSLFRLPDLAVRICVFHGDEVYLTSAQSASSMLEGGPCLRVGDLLDGDCRIALTRQQVPMLIDLRLHESLPQSLKDLRDQGFCTLLRAPLTVAGELVGMLELADPAEGAFNSGNRVHLGAVLPTLATAVARSLDVMNLRLQAVVNELFTAIHPATEWRFLQAAATHIRSGPDRHPESVTFEEVHPLFGISDIRSSSILRNEAIQADLLTQLRLMARVLAAVDNDRELPYVSYLAWRVNEKIRRLEPGLGSCGDESSVLDVLQREAEPLLTRSVDLAPAAQSAIEAYRAALDPRSGVVYRERHLFEESLTRLTEALASHLHHRQMEAQRLFPHYFEMHRSDGVDHQIYCGPTMLQAGAFHTLYLRNLRLWQLVTVCEMARKAWVLRTALPVPLETTHLVFVQETPLTIRFSLDEKQFVVEGAYNTRYAVVKSRLDKATVNGTEERLTQPGVLAIVYSQPREADEYLSYLSYLVRIGQVEAGVERVTLNDVKAMGGLGALRVKVAMQEPAPPAGDAVHLNFDKE